MNQQVVTPLESYNQQKINLSNTSLPRKFIVPKLTIEQKDVIDLQFKIQGGKLTVFHSDRTIKKYGWDNFVITHQGVLKVGKRHYALGEQKEALGAGSLIHLDGVILALTNNSAHYKPTFEEAQKSYKYLEEVLLLDLSKTLDHTFYHTSSKDFLEKEYRLRRFWMKQLIEWNKIYKR